MKRAREDGALADHDRVLADRGEHLHPISALLDPRRPDEDTTKRLRAETADHEVLLKARELAPKGVSATGRVEQAEVIAPAEDHPGAGAQDGAAGCVVLPDRPGKAVALDCLRDRGGFTPRDYERVDLCDLGRGAHLAGVGAELCEHADVRRESTLAGEDAYAQALCLATRRNQGAGAQGLDPAVLEQLALGSELCDVVAAHRLAEVHRGSCDPRGIGSMRGRLDDRPGAALGIGGLEDA